MVLGIAFLLMVSLVVSAVLSALGRFWGPMFKDWESAAHLIDLMEHDGIVGAADGPKPREVLKRPDWISEVEESMR